MANYAFIENNNIEGLYDSLPDNWRNISNFYVLSDEEILEFGWKKIIKPPVEFDSATQRIGNVDYYLLGVDVYERTELINVEVPVAEDPAMLWEKIRLQRDTMMDQFQWRYSRYERQTRLGLPTTDTIENMDTYMQALADITTQSDPYNIIWPNFIG